MTVPDTHPSAAASEPEGSDLLPAREFHPLVAGAALGGVLLAWAFSPFLVGTIAALLVLIAVHELGHLAVARRAGMYAPEYAVGFGPTIAAVQRGETRWSLKALPFGGYVRIVGMSGREELAPELEPRAYRNRPTRWKIAVSAAGPGANLVFAVLLLTVVLAAYGKPTPNARPVVGAVAATMGSHPSPAARAGLHAGDRVVAVTVHGDRTPVARWSGLVHVIASHPGVPLTLEVERAGIRRTITATPGRFDGRGKLGISQAVVRDPVPLPAAAVDALGTTGRATVATYAGIGRLIGGFGGYLGSLGHPDRIPTEHRMISVVGASNLAESAAHHGLAELLSLAAVINVAVAAFNLLPVLPFDGGHIAVAGTERLLSTVRRRETRLAPAFLTAMSVVVLSLVLVMGLSAMYLDVVAPIRL